VVVKLINSVIFLELQGCSCGKTARHKVCGEAMVDPTRQFIDYWSDLWSAQIPYKEAEGSSRLILIPLANPGFCMK
jgi:hypothetical protein